MKKIIEKHIAGFEALLGGMLCLLIVLGVYVYCDIRNDSIRNHSLADLFQTEMYNAADRLYSELNSGNYITAYHYSKSAEEYAARANLKNEGRLFSKIAFEIENNGTVGGETSEALLLYLTTGRVSDNTITAEFSPRNTENEVESGWAGATLSAVSKYKIAAAEKSAENVVGVDRVFHLCEKNSAGELIFTCKNAYAVIDEKTGEPIESMLSLERGDENISSDGGLDAVRGFLGMFYPRSSVASIVVEKSVTNEACGTYDYTLLIDGREALVSVKCDSGKVVRIISR
ncbi:MAG: hypothetical protein E7672_03130 [Ruminococcaceae bacterium]|nr:hypothetical protein [Oscillospiraceae bacterium]